MDKSFKLTDETKTNIENYNKPICLQDSMKKQFQELLSVFDSDGSGNLETKNKNGENEVEAYFNAITQFAKKSNNNYELGIEEAQALIDNELKNSNIKAQDLINFSNTIAKTIEVSTICNNINNFTSRSGITTTNIGVLTHIAKTQITSDNVLEVLEKYKKQNGESFFDKIASYKLANDNERKELVLDVFNKLVANVKARGKDIELLEQLGIDEIKHQFNKTGFIDKDNVNAFFDALTIIARRETTNLKAGKNDKYVNEFKITKYKNKKENIAKIENIIIGKIVTYSLADGTTINEEYAYDSAKKEYVMEARRWKNKKGEDIKTATYYSGDENSIRSVHLFENNEQVETHFYRLNGIESATTYSAEGQFRCIQFGENGVAEQDTTVKNSNTDKSNETTTYYDANGEIDRGFSAVYKGIINADNQLGELTNIYSLTAEEADFTWLPNFTMPYRIETYDKRTQINIMKVLFEQCKKHPSNDGAKINKLKNQALEYIEDGEINKAWSCYKQAYGRVTVNNNRRLKSNDKNNELIANGKIDKDFRQGNFGTCWLTAAIKSLSLNSNGQKILDEIVKKDPKTGNIIVTLKGAPKGQQVYTYPQEQIIESSELTTGDGDERAVEMAVRDLFMKKTSRYKSSFNTLDGNNLQTAFEILTGKDVIQYFKCDETGIEDYTYDSFDMGNNCKGVQKYLQGKLDSLIGKKNIVAQCSFLSNFDTTFIINKQGTTSSAAIYTGHAYSLKSVDKEYVYVINPWDTSKTVKIARKDFEKYCEEITMLDI